MSFIWFIRFCKKHKKLPTLKFYRYCQYEIKEAKKKRLMEWGI